MNLHKYLLLKALGSIKKYALLPKSHFLMVSHSMPAIEKDNQTGSVLVKMCLCLSFLTTLD